MEVVIDDNSTADEHFAAHELSQFAGRALCDDVPIVHTASHNTSTLSLVVGYNAAVKAGGVGTREHLGGLLGNESYIISTAAAAKPGHTITTISGGWNARRGAIYGVSHLLELLGYRFYSPNVTVVPNTSAFMSMATALISQDVNIKKTPAMELRSLESFETNGGGDLSRMWELRNRGNGCEGPMHGLHPPGGCMSYAGPPGLVHTSCPLYLMSACLCITD